MTRAAVLVIGFGNPLRSDDGIGPRAAALMDADPRLTDVKVVARHQLTPELVEDVGAADVVVFADARHDQGEPGSVSVEILAGDGGQTFSSHFVDPRTLLQLAEEMYGRAPRGYLVTAAASSFEFGDTLTPEGRAMLPRVVEAIEGIVAEHGRA